jgi:Fur family ferric uptake transcriptional regulator
VRGDRELLVGAGASTVRVAGHSVQAPPRSTSSEFDCMVVMPPSGNQQERSTRQKRALAAVLDEADGFRSAQDLYSEVRARGNRVGLTTVYNQLRSLADAGRVDTLRADDGETLYRRCATGSHHHHLVCRRCGTSVEVEAPELESWAEKVATANSFVDVDHTLEIMGTCPGCVTGDGPSADSPVGRY